MTQSQQPSKALNIILWLVQALLAVFLLMGTALKFMPIEKLSAMMPWTGQVPEWIVRLLGLVDMLGAIGLIVPALLRIKPQVTSWAAWSVFALMICATVFHVVRGEASVIGTNIVAGLMALFIAWGRTKKVPIVPK